MALQSAGEIRLLVADLHKTIYLDALRFAVHFEIESDFAAVMRRHAIDCDVPAQVVEVSRRAVSIEIIRTCTGHMLERAEMPRDEIRVRQFTELDAAVDCFGHQIHCTVADANGKVEVGIACMEVVERRQHDCACHRAGHFNAQTAGEVIGGVPDAGFHFVDIGEDLRTAFVIGGAFRSDAEPPRGAGEQLRAEQGFQILDDGSRRRARNVQRFRCAGEAVRVHNPDECAHGGYSVYHSVPLVWG